MLAQCWWGNWQLVVLCTIVIQQCSVAITPAEIVRLKKLVRTYAHVHEVENYAHLPDYFLKSSTVGLHDAYADILIEA